MEQIYNTLSSAPQPCRPIFMPQKQRVYFQGERLKEVREKMGLSQEKLAQEMGVTDKAISKWERSKGNPSVERLNQLHEIFGCSIDYFFGFVATPYRVSEEERLPPAERRFLDFLRRGLLPPPLMQLLELLDTIEDERKPPAIESGRKNPKSGQKRTSKR